MRRTLAWLMLLALLLCGCGKSKAAAEREEETESGFGVDAKTGAWIGQGGCYTLAPADYPKNCQQSFLYKGERCCVVLPALAENALLLGDREILRTEDMISWADAGEDGIWVALEDRNENGSVTETMVRLDENGAERERLALHFPTDSFPMRFAVKAAGFCFQCSDALRLFDWDGNEQGKISHPEWSGTLLKGSTGALYYVEQEDRGGGSVSRVETQTAALTPLFDYPTGYLCAGDETSPLLLMQSDGIYRLDENGETAPLVIWAECGLALSGVMSVEAEADGCYLVRGVSFEPMRLTPAQPGEIKPRTRLKLAMMGSYGSLATAVAGFNARSADICVELVDLTEGGLTDAEALTRLSTQLIAGEGPDMLAFRNGALSPFPYLRKGMLRDLEQDVEADPDIDLDDIWTAGAIWRDCGGLYLLAADFSIETRLGLRETFGDTDGWSFDAYLALARATPPDRMVMYNLTREYFFREAVSRYLRQTMDWRAGTCDFESPDFIRLLEACRDMRETPEDPNNMVFGSNLMADGFMATELVMLNRVTDLARSTRRVGKPISVIGFPTPDGSCGTDMGMNPVGVLTITKHPAACWAFLKDWLLHPSAIPAYDPLLREDFLEAKSDTPKVEEGFFDTSLTPPLTDAEEQIFYHLLEAIEHTTLCDETAMGIIREEAAGFFAGQRGAEETARLIQSRMSLYISEQT